MSKQVVIESTYEKHDVIIVGGGPVGLFLGLNLVRKGIEVLILEAEEDIVQSPRALGYYPIVLRELEKVGILDEVVQAGYKNQEGLCFRTPAGGSNKVLARIPPGKVSQGSIDYVVQLGQPKLADIIRRRAREYSGFSIEYKTRFVGLKEESDFVNVESSTADGKTKHYSARFVVGCDGASSPVRNTLNIPFDGYTWNDWHFLAINIRYDFAKYGYPAANHVIDPEDWAVIVRASNVEEGLWRVATGTRTDVPVREIEKHVAAKLERLLPGPKPLEYELIGVNPYRAHERVAKTFHSGRVILCGDAAHVNNPLTALGLTTGLVDVAYLSRLLPQAFNPQNTPSYPALLGKYSNLRRTDYIKNVQKFALEGKLRMHSTDKKVVAEREDFFNMLNKNPGFGMFVASTMVDEVPDELDPGVLSKSLSLITTVLTTIGIIVRIIYWKINAGSPPKAES